MTEYHPASNLFPLMTGADYEALKADIAAYGQREPICLYDGMILDGRNRYRACCDLGLVPEYITYACDDPVAFVVSMNLKRRHLTSSQLAALALDVLPMLEEEARNRQGALSHFAHVTELIPEHARGESRDAAAIQFQTNSHYVQDAKRLRDEAPDIFERVRAGETTIPEAKRESRERQRVEERQARVEEHRELEDQRIITGDFRDAGSAVADDSIDLIFTDPPYDRESIPLYGDLAQFAARVLKPGGSLIVYAGHYALPEIFELMCPHLRYWWIIACKHNGASARLPGKWVFVEWKPLLWFVKGGLTKNNYVADLIESEPVDKSQHDWQQSTVEARYYIEKLTEAGGMVADPFCGSGTTLLAAAQAGRQFIGLEKDADAAIIARQRIAEYQAGRRA